MRRLPKRKTNRLTSRDRLAFRIKIEHAAIRRGIRDALTHAQTAGVLLLKAKGEMAHKTFMPWVRQCCEFSHSTANLYMRIAREWARIEANSERIANLSLGAVGEWLRRKPTGPAPHGWARKYRALEARVIRAGQMLRTLLPAMNRIEAEDMRTAFLTLRRRVDAAVGQLDHHIAGEIDEGERARIAAVLAEIGVEYAAEETTPTPLTDDATGVSDKLARAATGHLTGTV